MAIRRRVGQHSYNPLHTSYLMAGGAEGDRTPDLLNAIQTLYQLSYDPSQKGTANLRRLPALRKRNETISLRAGGVKQKSSQGSQ